MPSLFDTFRFTANDGSDHPVTPLISGLKRTWQREGDTRAYRPKINTKLLFRGADYTYFRAIYDAGTCTDVTLLIENYCGGEWVTWHEGKIPIYQGEYNASRCEVSFDIAPNDVYECANKGFSKNANWLDYAVPVEVKTLYGTIGTITCSIVSASSGTMKFTKNCFSTGFTTSSDPDPALAWRPISHEQHYIIGGNTKYTTVWAREETTSVGSPPGLGWINTIADNWARPISVGFITKLGTSFEFTWQAQTLNHKPVSNGRKLGDLLTEAVTALGCDIDMVVSDFFNINPDMSHPVNGAYDYALANFQNVFFFQKSDIVRASASNDATRFETNLQEFFKEMELLQLNYALYNVGGVKTLRIEHYTYFDGVAGGFDLTTVDGGKYIVGLDSFKKEVAIPSFESFAYQESYRPKFLVQRIDYPDACVTGPGNERTASLLNADFGGLIENPDAGLDGFFLLATEDLGGGEYLMNTLGGEANGAFAWENLLPALWADGRFHMDATSTVGAGYVVNSIKKSREQPPITMKFCCSDEFEPSQLITTQIGEGEVKQAEQDTERGTLKLTLIH
jgi:hypothetical protein